MQIELYLGLELSVTCLASVASGSKRVTALVSEIGIIILIKYIGMITYYVTYVTKSSVWHGLRGQVA